MDPSAKKQQRQQKATKKASQKMDHSKKARNENQQKTNKSSPMWPTYRQMWVKKVLLKAQGQSTYKWLPKQLLKQATIPAKKPTTQQQRSTRQTWLKRQITQKWIPMDALTKQGYFEGAYYIWIPKNKKSQVVPE